jgi:hypothetical protein
MRQLDVGQGDALRNGSQVGLRLLPLAPSPRSAYDVKETIPAARGSGGPGEPGTLPWPQELPGGLRHCRVLQLTDADAVSHGLADGTSRERASDDAVRSCLALVHATAKALDPHARIRCAASSRTAVHHLDVLTSSANNQWAIRRGLDGADYALLEELTHLIDTRMIVARRRPRQLGGIVELVILVGQDRIYADAVRRLRLLGIPTWLVVPGRLVAASLYSAASAASFIGPASSSGHPATPGSGRPQPQTAAKGVL